jgi:hypothetical protein
MFANAGSALRRADGHQLTERRIRSCRVAVSGLPAAEVVPVIEKIEALQAEQDARPFRRSDAALDEHSTSEVGVLRNADLPMTVPLITGRRYSRRRRCCRPRRGIERPRRRELRHRTRGDM